MRVLHLAPERNIGSGIAAYAALYEEALRAAGIDIDLLVVTQGAPNGARDVRTYCRAAVEESRRGYDVVHAELGGGALREFYAARAIQRAGTAAVCLTLHEAPRLVWWPFYTHLVREYAVLRALISRLGAPLTRRLERSVLAAADAVCVLSVSAPARVREAFPGVQVGDIAVLPYPMRAWEHAQSSPANVDSKQLVVGYFGYWYRSKGVELIVEAIARTKDDAVPIYAKLWGDPSRGLGRRSGESYRRSILRAIERRGVANRVEVLGHLERDRVSRSLHNCDAIILPYEVPRSVNVLMSTSAAMFDAFAAGTPVVAADLKALGDVVHHRTNGLLFPPGDVKALVELLRELRDDLGLRRTLRMGAQATASGFAPHETAAKARQVYEQIRARHPRPC